MKVSDQRRQNFTIIQNEILDIKGEYLRIIGSYGLLVYAIVCSKANDTRYVPSVNQISRALNISKPTITKSFRLLEEVGLIKIIKSEKGFKNKIVLLDFKKEKEEKNESSESNIDYDLLVEKQFRDFTPSTKQQLKDFLNGSGIKSEKITQLLPLLEKLIGTEKVNQLKKISPSVS